MAEMDRHYLSALIRDVHRGSTDAFAAIFLGTVDDIYRRACRSFDSVYDVQDYIRDVFIRLWRELPGITGAARFNRVFADICRTSAGKIRARANAGRIREDDSTETGKRTEGSPQTEKTKRAGASAAPLDPEIREQMLLDILSSADAGELTAPIDQIRDYNTYRRQRAALLRIIGIIVAFIIAMLPGILARPVYTETLDTSETGAPVCEVHIQTTIVGVRSVTATVDGYTMRVYRDSASDYRIVPSRNGTMIVRITLNNYRSVTFREKVEGWRQN